jgi:ABA4-like protein
MTAEQMFSIANPVALAGWLALIWAVFRKNAWLRDEIAGRWWPLGFAALYTLLILLFFAKAEGGFDTLANVQKLFTSPWAALAGWIHYLAFDLFIGALIARRIMEAGGSRLWLIGLLPATFLFGPIGLLASEVVMLFGRPAPIQST